MSESSQSGYKRRFADSWIWFALGLFLIISGLIWLMGRNFYSNYGRFFITIIVLGVLSLVTGIIKTFLHENVAKKKTKTDMTDIPKHMENRILGFYSHTSRMYNSGINTLTAIIFGWISFVGIAINPSIRMSKPYGVFFVFVFFLMASYIYYFRILRDGKFIGKIENDLGLRNYIRTELLPLDETLPVFGKLIRAYNIGERPYDDPKKMNLGEKISCSVIIILLFVTILLVLTC